MFDANDPDSFPAAEKFGADILKLCVEVGGCLTGEHGVGVEKRDLMPVQFSASTNWNNSAGSNRPSIRIGCSIRAKCFRYARRRGASRGMTPTERKPGYAPDCGAHTWDPCCCGAGTKSGMLRPVQAADAISTAGLTGITLYAPKESSSLHAPGRRCTKSKRPW